MASTNLICVADDQADYRFLLQQVFKQYFPAYSVRLFDSGYALLDELTDIRPKPSLILLDRHMPHFDGHQTLLALKANAAYKKIPVVIVSADASTKEINDCYETGANSFVIKKLDSQSIKQMMNSVCHYWLETNQEPIDQL